MKRLRSPLWNPTLALAALFCAIGSTAQSRADGLQLVVCLQSVSRGLTMDQARMNVKDISSLDVKLTLAKWKFQDGELAKLRQWAQVLIENPERNSFLPDWTQLIARARARNPQLQNQDVVQVIQMVMMAAYEEANKDPEPSVQRAKFYSDTKDRLQTNLTESTQLQALVKSQTRDPLTGSLIRLSASQRTLQRCQVPAGPTLKLECTETLISTTTELDNYQLETEQQIKTAAEQAQKASLDLKQSEELRRKRLEALSDGFKRMYDSVASGAR